MAAARGNSLSSLSARTNWIIARRMEMFLSYSDFDEADN